MYSTYEREVTRKMVVEKLINLGVEGIIQIGSGVEGYNDQYSDLDMMIAFNGDLLDMKDKLKNIYSDLGAFYIKDLQLRNNIYLITPFFKNGLEINSSLLPVELLSVKSPLWKIEYDKNGQLFYKMNEENKSFNNSNKKMRLDEEEIFDFMYAKRKLNIALKREDVIHANQMLEMMRGYVLNFQVIIENKKNHQFKSYQELNLQFQKEFLDTFPPRMDLDNIEKCCEKISVLLENIIGDMLEIPSDIKMVGNDFFN